VGIPEKGVSPPERGVSCPREWLGVGGGIDEDAFLCALLRLSGGGIAPLLSALLPRGFEDVIS